MSKPAVSSHLLGILFLLGSALLAPGLAAQEKAASEAKEPPYKRMLSGEAGKRAADLSKKIQELQRSGKFADAVPLVKEICELRRRHQGAGHWQTVSARWELDLCQKLASAPASDRKDHERSLELHTQARELHARGRYREAESLFRKVLAIQQRLFRDDHPNTAVVYNRVGESVQAQGNYATAELLFGAGLAVCKRLLGEEHPDTVGSYNNLARNLEAQAKYPAAESHYRNALAIAEKLLGEEHPDTAAIYNNLAGNLEAQAEYQAAEPLYRKALAIAKKVLGERDARTAACHNNVAVNLGVLGKYAAAEPHFRTALKIRRAIWGDRHPETAQSFDNLAANLRDQGEYTAAEPLARTALTIRQTVLGEGHLDTAHSFWNLADILGKEGKYGAAEPLARKALTIRRHVLGEEHPLTADSCASVGDSLCDQGKYAEAELLFREAVAIRRKILGPEHPTTATGYRLLAFNLNAQGKYDGAGLLFQKALAIEQKILGEQHPDTAASCNGLALNFEDQRKYAEAEVFLRRVLAIRRKVVGEEHPDTAASYNNLAHNLTKQRRFAEAERLLGEALAVCRKAFAGDDPYTAVAYNSLAQALNDQGKHTEAELFYRKALAIFQARHGEKHPRTAVSYNNLAANLMDLGKYEEAESTALRAVRTLDRARIYASFQGLERAVYAAKHPSCLLAAALQARNGKPLQAWQSLEADLARGLLDDLSARHSRPLLTAERDRENQLLKTLQSLEDQLVALAISKTPRPELQKKIDALQEKRDQTQRALLEFQQQLVEKYGPAVGQVYDCARIQSHLGPETALLAWVDLAGRSTAADPNGEHWACLLRSSGDPIWVKLPGSGPRGRWSADDDKLPSEIRALCSAGPGKDASAWKQPIARFARQRLTPLQKDLQAAHGLPAVKHLVILPSRHLLGVPIEVLTERYTVSYAPSGTFFSWLQEKKRPGNRPAQLLAVGDPTFAPPAEIAKETPLPAHGILVMAVLPQSNAARAGIKADDVMLCYGGTKLTSLSDLPKAVKKYAAEAAGKKVAVELWRDGKTLSVQLAAGPLGVQLHKQAAAETFAAQRQGDKLMRSALDKTYSPLPGTRREVEAIAGLFSASRTMLGAKASAQAIGRLGEDEQLSQFAYLHIATHGELNNRVALQSALVLAGGPESAHSCITAEQILRTWKLDADLVTLSACQTGLGQPAGGEGYLGFSQALFLAGARSLVVSLWKVDDTATALLMVRFYENLLGRRAGLKAPMPKAEALAEAKRWLRGLTMKEAETLAKNLPTLERIGTASGRPRPTAASDRPYEHPYYWAAFILIGDPR
jgi:tetratricopeptide (TPR) repeat protein